MHVLTLNTGSSSVRLAAYESADGVTATATTSRRYALDQHESGQLLRRFLDDCGNPTIDAVAHRVVHGGDVLTRSCRIDAAVEAEIERLSILAPLHNPPALDWIRASRELFREAATQIAVFDTAFFSSLPDVARHYALPQALVERHRLRRYGFHGLAHEAMWRRWCELRPDLERGGRVVSFQLGSGCSVAAIAHGAARDTSMGFSPLEGLMMATRCGDLDPGIVTYLQRHSQLTAERIDELLNRESGLRGVAGEADMQRLLARDDVAARLAVGMYCYRARKYLGAYLAALGGADAVLFGGGVGENAPAVRARILADMEWAGIGLDAAANRATGTEACIGRSNSGVALWVMSVDESAILAREALGVMRNENGQD